MEVLDGDNVVDRSARMGWYSGPAGEHCGPGGQGGFHLPRVSRGLGASVRPVCGRRLPARYGTGQTTPGPS